MSGQFLHSSTGLIDRASTTILNTFGIHVQYFLITFWLRVGYVLVTQIHFWLRFGYALTEFGYVLVTFWLRGYRPGTNFVTRIF